MLSKELDFLKSENVRLESKYKFISENETEKNLKISNL